MKAVNDTVKFIAAGIVSLGMDSEVTVEAESETEFLINVPGLGIEVLVETDGTVRRSIGGREFRGPKWQVFGIKHIPSSRFEPEDAESVHRGDFDLIAEAVSRVFELAIKDHILNMVESIGMADEHEEFERVTRGLTVPDPQRSPGYFDRKDHE